ncbi:hypothetical protein [Aquabacterium humicola]|uniref:hypothetical protein n=1 Tax=Aquabacterium humicola TaxID=3237377 RepID=UPI002542DBC0|nr:hypothetical protein [Rubrivivax pictus]
MASQILFAVGALASLGSAMSVLLHREVPGGLVLMLAGALPLGFHGLRRHVGAANALRDAAAADFVARSSVDGGRPLVLFLRPFLTDALITADDPPLRSALLDVLLPGVGRLGGLESRLVRAVEPRAQLVRLDGGHAPVRSLARRLARGLTHRIGAISILPGQPWVPVFEQVAERADAFVFVPPLHLDEANPTTTEFTHLLKSGAIRRAAILMPWSWKVRGGDRKPISAAATWHALRQHLASAVTLPALVKGGGWVIHSPAGFIVVRGLSGMTWDAPRTIDRVLSGQLLLDPAWRDALRVALRLSAVLPIVLFVGLGGLAAALREVTEPPVALKLAGGLAAATAMTFFFFYCELFMLAVSRARLMFVVSLLAYVLGTGATLSIADSALRAYQFDEASQDIVMLVMLALSSVCGGLLVFLSAWPILRGRAPLYGVLARR